MEKKNVPKIENNNKSFSQTEKPQQSSTLKLTTLKSSTMKLKKMEKKNLSIIYSKMKNNYKDIMNKILSGEFEKEKSKIKEEKEREKEELEEYEKKGIKKEELEEEIKFHNEIFNDINEEKKDDVNLTEEQINKNDKKLEEISKKIIQGNLNQNFEKKKSFLVKETVAMGKMIKKKIEFEKKNNPEKFINPDENLKSDMKTNKLFPIAVLAKSLEKSGISTAIEKNSSNPNVSQACLQMIFNGITTKTKLDLKFDFGEKENKKMLNNEKLRKKFEEDIIKKISKELNIPSDEIFFINPREGSFEDTLILPIDMVNFSKLVKLKISQILKNQKGFIELKESALAEALYLSEEMLEPEFNKSEDEWPKAKEYRGPMGKRYEYFPPHNWKGYALKVRGKYENDNWLTYQNTPGEWWIAYHGLGNPHVVKNILDDGFKTGKRHEFIDGIWENDLNHPGKSTRHGAYFTPIPEYAEYFAEEKHGIMINGENYIIAFMCRVNPETIMVREPAPCEWISSGGEDDVRPYRILIKKNEKKGFGPADEYRNMEFVVKRD